MKHPPSPICAIPRCLGCGTADVMTVSPGDDGEYTEVSDQRIYTLRPVAARAWCCACAPAAGFPWLRGERRAGAGRGA